MIIRAENKIIAGKHKGKMISQIGKAPCIILNATQAIALDNTNVNEIELIDDSSDISVASATTRGFIGEMLFGPIGLAATGTARRNERYIVKIAFKDGDISVLELDDTLYKLLVTANE